MVSRSMFLDHMPDNTLNAMQMVGAALGQLEVRGGGASAPMQAT